MQDHDDLSRSLDEFDPDDPHAPWVADDLATPQDDRRVAAMVRQVSAIDRELARLKSYADYETRRIKLWVDDLSSGLKSRRRSIERALEGFARQQRRKTIPYPYGQLKLRGRQPVVVVDDEEAFVVALIPPRIRKVLQVMAGHPMFKVTIEPSKSGIAKGLRPSSEPDDEARERAAKTWARANDVLGPPNVEVMALGTEDGTLIPGVHLVKPLDDKFSITPTDDKELADE